MAATPSRIEEIFEQALQRAPGTERDAFLDGACGGDTELRGWVDRLVQAADNAGSFLQTSVTTPQPTRDQATFEGPGTQIGPYKLLQEIGEGGMGVVYMAEQTQPVKRRVALKLVKPGMDSRQVVARFEAERQALALMDHPHIAKVLDCGTTEHGRPYFVMELVKGIPITRYCDENHLTPRERLELFVPICQAIQHAHQKGIIHRDIKPSNILVAEYDQKPVPKIIDFGVAKALNTQLTDKTMFTQLGQVVGTLEYMSPEQSRVNQLDVDTRSDIYSLGVLLYELLTGATPFDQKRFRAAALDEMLRIIREEEPPRPSTRLSTIDTLPSIAANRKTEPRKLSSLLRGELDWIVMKALEKDRNRRYETANGFALDIQRYLNDEAVLACPPSATYRFRKFALKNKGLLGATVAVATALVIGLIGTTWQAIRATRAEQLAIASEQRAIEERDAKELLRQEAQASAAREAEQRRVAEAAAQSEREAKEAERIARESESAQRLAAQMSEKKAIEETAIARAVTEFLQEDLLGLAGAEAQLQADFKPDPDVKLSTLLDRALLKVEERFADQPRIRAAVQATLAEALYSIGRYAQAAELWEKVGKYREQALGLEHSDTLASMNSLALAYQRAGQNDKALPLHEKTSELLAAKLGLEHSDTLISMVNLSLAYCEAGDLNKALPLAEEMLKRTRGCLGPDHPTTLDSMHALAFAYRTTGDQTKSLQLLEQMLALRKAKLGNDHPVTLTTMNNLAGAYLVAGLYDNALPLYEQTLELRKSILGDEHPVTLASMNNLAEAYREAGQVAKALPLFEQTLELQKIKLGREHPDTLYTMNNLALAYRDAADSTKALSLFEQTLELRKTRLGPEHPETLKTMNNLALAYCDVGNLAKAVPLLEQTLELQKIRLGSEHPSTLNTMNNLAAIYHESGQWAKALPLLEQSLELQKAKLGLDHPDTLISMINLAKAYHDASDMAKALPLYEQILEQKKAKQGIDHADTLYTMNSLATAYQAAGQLEKALPLFEQALPLATARLGPEHPGTVTCMGNLAAAYHETGQLEQAMPLYEQALTLARTRLGPEHPSTVTFIGNLAAAYYKAGQHDKALPLFEQTFEFRKSKLGPDHPETLASMIDLALAHNKLDDHLKAVELAQAAIASPQLRFPKEAADRQMRAQFLLIAASNLNRLGRSEEAESLAREAVAIRQELTPDAWSYYSAVSLLGECLSSQQKFVEAEELLQSGYEGLKQHETPLKQSRNEQILNRAVERLIKLYEMMNRPEDVVRWQSELQRLEGPGNESSAS